MTPSLEGGAPPRSLVSQPAEGGFDRPALVSRSATSHTGFFGDRSRGHLEPLEGGCRDETASVASGLREGSRRQPSGSEDHLRVKVPQVACSNTPDAKEKANDGTPPQRRHARRRRPRTRARLLSRWSSLALYPRSELAKDAAVPAGSPRIGGISL